MRRIVAALASLAIAGGAIAAAPARSDADQLVMFEQQACPFCADWNRHVGRIYAKTDEAKVLPLRRVDIDVARPADLASVRGIVFTPTFVVTHCGREIRRITGYISDEQFWGLLDEAVKALKAELACGKSG